MAKKKFKTNRSQRKKFREMNERIKNSNTLEEALDAIQDIGKKIQVKRKNDLCSNFTVLTSLEDGFIGTTMALIPKRDLNKYACETLDAHKYLKEKFYAGEDFGETMEYHIVPHIGDYWYRTAIYNGEIRNNLYPKNDYNGYQIHSIYKMKREE